MKPNNWSEAKKKRPGVRLTKDLEEAVARKLMPEVQEAMTDKRAGLVEAHCRKGGSKLWLR